MTSKITTDEKGFSVIFELRGVTYMGSATYDHLSFSTGITDKSPNDWQKVFQLQPSATLLVNVPIGAVPDTLYVTLDIPPLITMQLHRIKEDTVLYL